jgi:hypothetical protein
MPNIVSQNPLSFGQGSEFLSALIRAGLTPGDAQRVIEDRALAGKLVGQIRGGDNAESEYWRIKNTMGNHFISPNKCRLVGLPIRPAATGRFGQVPFQSVHLIQAAKEGAYLVAMPKVNFTQIYHANTSRFVPVDLLTIPPSTTQQGYYLIRALSNSSGMTLNQQVEKLPLGYRLLTLAELAYYTILSEVAQQGGCLTGCIRTGDWKNDFETMTIHRTSEGIKVEPYPSYQQGASDVTYCCMFRAV